MKTRISTIAAVLLALSAIFAATHDFVPELIHNRSGVGSPFVVTDLIGDGAPDIVISCVKGTFIFWNQMHARPQAVRR